MLVLSDHVYPLTVQGKKTDINKRLMGEDSGRVYLQLLLIPSGMDFAHKETVHLGEEVTLTTFRHDY